MKQLLCINQTESYVWTDNPKKTSNRNQRTNSKNNEGSTGYLSDQTELDVTIS